MKLTRHNGRSGKNGTYIQVLDALQKGMTGPKSNNSPQVKKIADQILGRAKEKLREAAGKILQKVQAALMKPEARKADTAEIKKKAKESIYAKLEQARLDAQQRNAERHTGQDQKKNMEL